jgi:hypothetical protein
MKETELKHMSVRHICKDAMLSIVYRFFSGQKCSLILSLNLLTSYDCECLQEK